VTVAACDASIGENAARQTRQATHPRHYIRGRMRAPACAAPLLVALAVAGGVARPAFAQTAAAPDTAAQEAPVDDAPDAAAAEGRLAIHGYLTQGYAASDGTPFYGIRGQASSDFRYAALQFRYDRDADGFLVQVNHRRLGKSPITTFESAVNVNWAFYERRTDAGSSLRVGRVPVPRGIYNEQRSIGVVLPFYRAPVIFYDEGAYFSETIDGVVLSHTFMRESPWSIEVNGYGGGWSLLAYDQTGSEYLVNRIRAENAVGTQLWVNTPVEGLRVGSSYQRYRWENQTDGMRQDVQEFQASVDAAFPRVTVRAETMMQDYETDDYYASYLQTGINVTPKLAFHTQFEYAYERNWDWGVYTPSFDWHKAAGVGFNYKLNPALVLKLEHHWNKGIQVEQPADPATAPRFRYAIASLSASF
jgi:hypothetical protein